MTAGFQTHYRGQIDMNRKTAFYAAALASMMSLNASALNIALSNDDGWDAAGVQTLFTALRQAGHSVTLAGPSENQSGGSASVDLNAANLRITKTAEDGTATPGGDQYSVALTAGGSASPATAAQIAISIAEQAGPVDLLVSGINAGANTGAGTNISGTVGGTIVGISNLTGERIPGVAISTDEVNELRDCAPADLANCEAANLAHYQVVARWFVEFVAELEQKPGGLKKQEGLLPDGIALNINYPVTDQVAGVKSDVQALLFYRDGVPVGLDINCYGDCANLAVGETVTGGISGLIPMDTEQEVKNADAIDYNAGYITIVPINTDLTAPKSERKRFKKLVKKLNKNL